MAFSATELLASGYSAADARTMGLKPVELKEGGYSLEEIKSAGFSQWQLRDSFPSWMLIGKLRPPATASKVSLPSERLPPRPRRMRHPREMRPTSPCTDPNLPPP